MIPILRIIVFWGLCWGIPIHGNYHLAFLIAKRAHMVAQHDDLDGLLQESALAACRMALKH